MTTEFTWDARGRLASVKNKSVPGGSGNYENTYSYTYDAQDRRVVRGGTGDFIASGVHYDLNFKEAFVYEAADDRTVMKFGSATQWSRYLTGVNGAVLSQEKKGSESAYQWLVQDYQGSTVVLSDKAGARKTSLRYDGRGAISSQTGEGSTEFGYLGRQYDEESGLQLNGARYYNGGIGRFISQDPLGLNSPDGTNLYLYARNNYPNRVDVNGRSSYAPEDFDSGDFGDFRLGASYDWRGGMDAGYSAFASTLSSGFTLGYSGYGGASNSNFGLNVDFGNNPLDGYFPSGGSLLDTQQQAGMADELRRLDLPKYGEMASEQWSYLHRNVITYLGPKDDWLNYYDPHAEINTRSTRLGGVSQAAFSAVGAAITLPTVLTGVGGVAFGTSIDNLQAGLRTMWTGEYTPTMLASATSGGMQLAGVDAHTAQMTGEFANLGVSLGSNVAVLSNYQSLSTLSSQRWTQVGQALDALALDTLVPSPLFSNVVSGGIRDADVLFATGIKTRLLEWSTWSVNA